MNTELKGELKFMSVELVDFKISSITCDNQVICHLNNEKLNDDQVKYFANVFIDAGNTIQSCGLLPSELLKQNHQMRSFLNKINNDYEAFSDLSSHGYGEELEKLIESTNP